MKINITKQNVKIAAGAAAGIIVGAVTTVLVQNMLDNGTAVVNIPIVVPETGEKIDIYHRFEKA